MVLTLSSARLIVSARWVSVGEFVVPVGVMLVLVLACPSFNSLARSLLCSMASALARSSYSSALRWCRRSCVRYLTHWCSCGVRRHVRRLCSWSDGMLLLLLRVVLTCHLHVSLSRLDVEF